MRYLLILLLLTGCATTPEERAQRMVDRYGPACEVLGFTGGTNEWRNCVMQQAAIDNQRRGTNAAIFQTTRPAPR